MFAMEEESVGERVLFQALRIAASFCVLQILNLLFQTFGEKTNDEDVHSYLIRHKDVKNRPAALGNPLCFRPHPSGRAPVSSTGPRRSSWAA